ncbi:MAG: DUF1292 domain-containing protein [Clostridiales bacterium]|jgi:uncharacterized protein YrzB (UPF0473 family)|nr:DUF1292 domain-containing protein [Clostridiales bacterium]
MGQDRDDIIILIDENGEEVEFEHIDTIAYNGNEYVVLLPADEHADEDGDCDCDECEEEIIILRVEQTGGDEDTLVTFDDEDEQNAVFELFTKRMEDMEGLLEDEDDDEDDEDDDDDPDGDFEDDALDGEDFGDDGGDGGDGGED